MNEQKLIFNIHQTSTHQIMAIVTQKNVITHLFNKHDDSKSQLQRYDFP